MKILILLLALSVTLLAQSGPTSAPASRPAAAAATAPADLAKAALNAHGGEKLKKLRSFLVKGAVDLGFQGQSVTGVFSTAFSGEKYYFEIVTPIQQLKQVFDGTSTNSSLQGFTLPPVTSLGFPLLPRVGDPGFVVGPLPEGSKKKRGFRMTTPEGFYTDFFIDEKTGQIKGYEAKWMSGQQAITTSVEIDEVMTVDGVVVPKKYAQRFDLGPIAAYATFRARDVKINSPIEDSAFTIK